MRMNECAHNSFHFILKCALFFSQHRHAFHLVTAFFSFFLFFLNNNTSRKQTKDRITREAKRMYDEKSEQAEQINAKLLAEKEVRPFVLLAFVARD